MNPEFQEIVSPRQLRHSPVRDSDAHYRQLNSSQTRGLRTPGFTSRIPPPSAAGRRQPALTQGLATPSRIGPPSRSQLQTPQAIRRPEQIRPPSGLRPPGFFKPSLQSTPLAASSSSQKVIPLPGSANVLAQVPRPSRIPAAPTSSTRIAAPPVSRVPSTSLLPKPSFLRSQSQSRIVPPSKRTSTPQRLTTHSQSRLVRSAPRATGRPRTAPATPRAVRRVEPSTPVRRPQAQLPRTAVKQRIVTDDTEVYSIAGREVEFVDWVPSPEEGPSRQPVRQRPTSRSGKVQIAKGVVKKAPSRGAIPVEPKTPVGKARIHLPRTAAKQRVSTEDDDAEVFNIGGRVVEFVDYVPTPEDKPAPEPIRRPVARRGAARIRMTASSDGSPEGATLPPPIVEAMQAMKKSRKVHEFPDEPSVAAAKEFASKIDADIQRFRGMGADMAELKQRKSAVLSKIRSMYDKETHGDAVVLDVEGFRTKYGVTQSPKMRQLLEVTGDWNRAILDRQELAESLAQAKPFVPQEKPKLTTMLQGLAESPDRPDQVTQRRSELELARQERIDNYRQKKEADREYRRILEERRKNLPSRRPYSKQEREDIRKRYQEAQEWTYTAPTEEELDDALRLAEMMELEDVGVSVVADPEKTVETLFPEAAPSAEISGVVGDVPIPRNIPAEEINNMNNLDRTTAEVALKASLVPVPTEGVTKQVLETSIKEMKKAKIEPTPQKLDPVFEIDLKLGQPKRRNYIQLQGSSFPSWFPGFYSIFPGAPGLIKAMKSPSATLLTAFRQMHSSAAI
ncbi:uncharacterized protein LOC110676038 [Aedes aegypti]|uniref:Uncharacterized protein n=1 Tax=Aedes aegypti TaxID=7159 RepID=A0A6I8TN69_AEDAE|nr:uncharacterized protein LOC110676038 [Aedes aegypti]